MCTALMTMYIRVCQDIHYMLCYIMHVVYIGKFGDDTNVFIQPIFGRNAVQA